MSTVVLVNMPFADPARPSLGLGLLKATLLRSRISCQIIDCNVLFASLIGFDVYQIITNLPSEHLAGEWVFARALFGPDQRRDDSYRRLIDDAGIDSRTTAMLEAARAAAASFLALMAERITTLGPSIVGFSSLFHQNLACLALARGLKACAPRPYIVMGGANCEGNMGKALGDAFDCLDAVVSGDGDEVFPALCSAVLAGKSFDIPGVKQRASLLSSTDTSASTMVRNLDGLPFPDYDDYFDTLEEVKWPDTRSLALPFETSRGCWWGAKLHCTFCGLNGSSMTSRAKSTDRALAEISWLFSKYGVFTNMLCAADNIMPHHYHSSLLPALESAALAARLFYEIKANTSPRQVAQMKRSGVSFVQPGIESFSTSLLQHMQKGTSRLLNLRLLRSCLEEEVTVYWNYLIGFPGENPDWYVDETKLLPLIRHLPPPVMPRASRIRFDRFSPYLESPEAFGIFGMQPAPAYSLVYSGLPPDKVKSIAYHFVGSFSGQDQISTYENELNRLIKEWHDASGRAALAWQPQNNAQSNCVIDTRGREPIRHHLTEVERIILCISHEIRSTPEVAALAALNGYSSDSALSALASLEQVQLLVREGESVLSLVPTSRSAKMSKVRTTGQA